MPRWARLLSGWLVTGYLVAALLAVAPISPSTLSAAAAEPSDEACKVLGALQKVDPATAVTVTLELFGAAGAAGDGSKGAAPTVARRVIACVLAAERPGATETETNASVCKLAGALNEKKKFQEALAMVQALRTARDDKTLCPAENQAASEGAHPTVDAKGLGELWTTFQTDVVKPLAPIVSFVSLAAISLIAIARLVVIIGLFQDSRSWRWERAMAATVGLVLAIGTPALFAARALWFANRERTGSPAASDFAPFLTQLWSWAWGWWFLFLSLAAAAVALLAYWWATKPRMAISITAKNDGTGLDATRLMTTIDAMAGRPNSGIEFPVGTDLVDQAKAISEDSKNKFVAALQSLAKLLFGTSPWQLKVENEADGAVSMAISRNGRLRIARRLEVSGGPLDGLPEPSQVGRLSALVAGEVIAEMSRAYRSIRPGLNGAREPTSIAYQYVATTALASTPELRVAAVPLLQQALSDDPNNRGALATLSNYTYRDPRSVPTKHRAYERFLEGAIDNEVRQLSAGRWFSTWRARVGWWSRSAGFITTARVGRLPDGTTRVSLRRLRGDDLLTRLLQMHVVATRNRSAATMTSASDHETTPYERLWLYLNARSKRGNASRTLYARRRQLFLVDRFRELTWCAGTGTTRTPTLEQDGFRFRERRAWATSIRKSGSDARIKDRFACEEAVLRVWGDFSQDPNVAYTLACHRATSWLQAPEESEDMPDLESSLKELLLVASRDRAVREWYPVDPEMAKVQAAGIAPKEMSPAPKESERPVKPEDQSYEVLVKQLLAHIAKK